MNKPNLCHRELTTIEASTDTLGALAIYPFTRSIPTTSEVESFLEFLTFTETTLTLTASDTTETLPEASTDILLDTVTNRTSKPASSRQTRA